MRFVAILIMSVCLIPFTSYGSEQATTASDCRQSVRVLVESLQFVSKKQGCEAKNDFCSLSAIYDGNDKFVGVAGYSPESKKCVFDLEIPVEGSAFDSILGEFGN
ncbi:MAG: hypothetical protein HRT44_03510 [Bdellovibrionales bacterium]|nr:hypothetical protein [Bdellovibrionales bacterium]NQZ18313.1 hypothetical protein [Bdellovibrionales bacterium]